MADGDELVYRAASGTATQFLGLRDGRRGEPRPGCASTPASCCAATTRPPIRGPTPRRASRVGAVSMICVPLQHPDGATVGVLKVYASTAGGIRRGRRGDARAAQRPDRGAPDQRHAVRGRTRREPPRRAHRARQQARLRRGADPRGRRAPPGTARCSRSRCSTWTASGRSTSATATRAAMRCSPRSAGILGERAKRRPGIPGRRRRVRARACRDRAERRRARGGRMVEAVAESVQIAGQATLSMGVAEARSLDPRALHAEADAALHRVEAGPRRGRTRGAPSAAGAADLSRVRRNSSIADVIASGRSSTRKCAGVVELHRRASGNSSRHWSRKIGWNTRSRMPQMSSAGTSRSVQPLVDRGDQAGAAVALGQRDVALEGERADARPVVRERRPVGVHHHRVGVAPGHPARGSTPRTGCRRAPGSRPAPRCGTRGRTAAGSSAAPRPRCS